MRRFIVTASMAAILSGVPMTLPAEEISGDKRLACEAILCLSSPLSPAACVPSLTRYFAISFRTIADTARGRINFLKLCPSASGPDGDLAALVEAIGNGAGYCTAEALNAAAASVDVQDCPINPLAFRDLADTSGEPIIRSVVGYPPRSVPSSVELMDTSPEWRNRQPDGGDPCLYRSVPVVSPELPQYCVAYTRNPLTYRLGLHYEGHPLAGGQWIADR